MFLLISSPFDLSISLITIPFLQCLSFSFLLFYFWKKNDTFQNLRFLICLIIPPFPPPCLRTASVRPIVSKCSMTCHHLMLSYPVLTFNLCLYLFAPAKTGSKSSYHLFSYQSFLLCELLPAK